MIDYKTLSTTRNRHYDCDYWCKIRVLYEGAKTLKDTLHTPSPLRGEIFPIPLGEDPEIYHERVKRSCYVNYLSQLVDYIVSSLFSDPVVVTAGGAGEDMKYGSVEPFYDEFYRNSARPGARPVTFNEALRRVVLDALLFKRAWLLVEFPTKPLDGDGLPVEPSSRAEEELLEAGGQYKRAYCSSVDPESVYDWERDEDDELSWAMIYDKDHPRKTVDAKRTWCVETFTVYDRVGWTRYSWEYDEEKAPPRDSDKPTRTESGKHTFGRVPLLDFKIPDGLWAGGKMENIAVELFNKLSALSWGQYRSLFQIVAVTLQNPDPKDGFNPIVDDQHRAVNQTLGPGRVWVGAERDQIRYVGPDSAPFAEARAYLAELRDEMHRVLHQMAQSVDNSGAALKRSGESKKIDQAAGEIVSRELGRIFREVTQTIYQTIAAGRNEHDKIWSASGLENYTETNSGDLVAEAVELEKVSIPSPTWQALRKLDLVTKLTPGLTDKQKEKIYEELEASTTAPTPGSTEPGMDDGAEGTEAVDAVYSQLVDDFEPKAIEWVKNTEWELKNVPVDQIDYSGSAQWKATAHKAKVGRFVEKIEDDDKKPIILVIPPDGGKYKVVDGHHRALAYKRLNEPARAYVGTVSANDYPAALEMHAQQKDQDPTGKE